MTNRVSIGGVGWGSKAAGTWEKKRRGRFRRKREGSFRNEDEISGSWGK